MIISKVNSTNCKTNYFNLESSKPLTNAKFSGDKVAFKSLSGTAAAVLQEALQAGSSGLLGIRKVKIAIRKAHDLFDSYDVKPAIDLAIQMDAKFGRSWFQKTDDLLEKAVKHVRDLSDESPVNRDLKQKVLDYCFVHAEIPKRSNGYEAQALAEDLLADLNPKYFDGYKKFLIEKTTRTFFRIGERGQKNGITQFRDIDKVLNNIRDENFKARMKIVFEKEKKKWEEKLNAEGIDPIISLG